MAPSIAHDPLECIKAETFPQVDAQIASLLGVARTRVYFKAHQFPDWYYVDMKASEAARFLGTLPKPLPETRQLDYYVYALDAQFQTSQTLEYGPQVVKVTCRRYAGLLLPPSSGIVVGATKEGQPPVPPGFSPKGIAGFVTVAGISTQLPAGAASASGGAPPTVSPPSSPAGGGAKAAASGGKGGGSGLKAAGILVGLAAVGGGVALAARAEDRSAASAQPSPSPSPSPSPTPAPTPTPTPTPAPTPTPTPAPRNLTGVWVGTLSSPGCGCPANSLTQDLQQSGAVFQGTLSIAPGNTNCRLRGGLISQGSLTGDTVAFVYFENGLEQNLTFLGTVSGSGAGERMEGNFRSSSCDGSWSVQRR